MKQNSHPIRFVLMIVLCQCSSMVRPASQKPEFPLPEELQHYLPQTVTPKRYEVFIEHYIDAPIPYYSGRLRIEVHCNTLTNQLNFNHAEDLRIEAVEVKSLSNPDGSQFNIKYKNYLAGNQREVLLDKPFEKNKKYEIYITFSCQFSDTQGYILKKYKDDDSNRKVMTFTKLNEFDARRVIPCLDQINMKAKFKMWLLHPKRMTSFSNAAIKSWKDINTETQPNWVEAEFYETDYMATFSIFMALVQFKTTGRHTDSNVNVETWADEYVIDTMNQINIFASESFKFFSSLFKHSHPMNKLDILVLPNVEFEVEESFGIIFMSQKYALETVEKWSNIATYDLVLKICHAVSYQWIGSTVTMSQWQDTWFHQGLNYFLQRECAQEIFPEYPKDILQLNMIESFLGFMRSEELAIYGEPITILRSYPELKFMKFVTMEKVYHLIRMVEFIMTPYLFEESLAKYVKDFWCKNSDVDQALDVFTQIASSVYPPIIPFPDFEIQNIMKSWLHQKGAPLIIAESDYSMKKIIFHQTIFNQLDLSKGLNAQSKDRYWLIPLSCTTEKELQFDEVTPRVWLSQYENQWGLPEEFDKKDWFLCNLEFNVPGRVLYDMKTWISIQKFFVDGSKVKKINVLTRARLVSDMFTLAEAGKLTYEIVLNTMEYLQYEDEYIPWMIALKEFDRIRSRLLGSDLALLKRYQSIVRNILRPGFQRLIVGNFLQNPTKHSVENEFQILFMEISCKFDFEECSRRGFELIQIWSKISNLKHDLEMQHRLNKVVLCEQIKHGDKHKWDSLWDQYYKEESQSSKEDMLQAFGCLKKEQDLQRLLKKSIKDPQITQEDSIIIFQSLSSNKNGYKLMWNFFQNYYRKIVRFHSQGETSEVSYLRIIFDATNRMRPWADILYFASKKMIPKSDKLTCISMDNGRRNMSWFQRCITDLRESLRHIKMQKLFKKIKNILEFN